MCVYIYILFFIPKLFHNFVRYFSGGVDSRLGDSFDTNMDPTGRFTTQQPINIIKAYFATKSVLLTRQQCRKDFDRNSVPDRRRIQRLVAKFRETGSVADAQQRPHWSTSFKSFKSNKPWSFSILWLISSQNVSRSALFWSVCLCKIWIL